ncbi:hypothetical protein NL676_006489 [Syzygium grande]|nr:hypothetical protein NL676_006489 [Syzygium grande]
MDQDVPTSSTPNQLIPTVAFARDASPLHLAPDLTGATNIIFVFLQQPPHARGERVPVRAKQLRTSGAVGSSRLPHARRLLVGEAACPRGECCRRLFYFRMQPLV